MGGLEETLPSITIEQIHQTLAAVNVPLASKIEILPSAGAYHAIASICFDNDQEAILRVAGSHFPHVKTANEVAVISWLEQNTTIPVPKTIHYDSSTDNPLGCEYILQEKVPGVSLDMVWPQLSEDERLGVLDFAADCLLQLYAHEWQHVGSIQREEGRFIPGPVLDERFWDLREMEKFFPGQTPDAINPLGPFGSYVEYSIARIEKYLYCIRHHESLAFMREHLSLIEEFVAIIKDDEAKLNRGARLCLAHRDLHMQNIMYDLEAKRPSGVLDWEFSVVMPLQQGDLSRAFLHDMQDDAGWPERKRKLIETMHQRSKQPGLDVLKSYAYSSEDQEEMQEVVDLLRAIVEVSPREQRAAEKLKWRDDLLAIIQDWIDDD